MTYFGLQGNQHLSWLLIHKFHSCIKDMMHAIVLNEEIQFMKKEI